MDESFDMTAPVGDEVSVVSVAGEVDVAAAPTLRDGLTRAVERRPETLVVDLLGVTFIDSTALGVLIGTQRDCADKGVSLRLVVAESRIRKVFEITGLTEYFTIASTVAGASGTSEA